MSKIWTPDNSFLLEYHARIETGEIIVGRELWQELNNLKEDLLNDAYIYDTHDALLRIYFMENCVKLTKSPFYGKPMILMLWQKAFIEAIYSFKMSDTTFRRFQKVILLIARKNTKSETCSGLGLAELICGNSGADICCSSNDDTQANIIYNAIDRMRLMTDPKQKDTWRNQQCIRNKNTDSNIFKMSERTRNKEGRNIDTAFLDESHEMIDNSIADPIEQSQSVKDEPLFINITTEGFVVDGYLDGELVEARKIINGESDGESAIRTLPWLYTQDSEAEVWQNRDSWVKSNPTLIYGIKKWSYLDKQIDAAKTNKAKRIYVLSKDFNIKQNGSQSWLNLEDYDYECAYDIEKLRGAFCLGAVDLAQTSDLVNAKTLIMLPGDNKKYILSHYFISEYKLENDDDKKYGAKYKEWAEDGLITICEGNEVELSLVADWFYNLYTEFDIRLWKCGYDQRFAKEWINRMETYGWTKQGDELEMILQNAQTLNNAINLSETDLKTRLIQYNNNPVDKWCFKNALIQVDKYGNGLIVKNESGKKIDGSVTLAILYEMYRRHRTEYKNMVNN